MTFSTFSMSFEESLVSILAFKSIFKLIYLFFKSRLFSYKEMRYGACYMGEPCKHVSESNKI